MKRISGGEIKREEARKIILEKVPKRKVEIDVKKGKAKKGKEPTGEERKTEEDLE